MYLILDYTLWRFQTVWNQLSQRADDAGHVSSISSNHPSQQQHSWGQKHTHQDISAVLSPHWPGERHMLVC